MEQLITLIKEIESSEIEPQRFLTEEHHLVVTKIRSLLNDLMITEDGDLDYDNERALMSSGWNIYPLEYDRYGWLLGALITTKGDIVFG
jgi:hypothetical protein